VSDWLNIKTYYGTVTYHLTCCVTQVSNASAVKMSAIIYQTFKVTFATLYPAYASYKAVKTKNVKDYVCISK